MNINSNIEPNYDIQKLITRNKFCYQFISFIQGIGTISNLAINYHMKDTLQLEPYQMSTVFTVVSLPWILKPFLGLLTDIVPILGYRRKVYMYISSILGISACFYTAYFSNGVGNIIFGMSMLATAYCFATVIGEAIVVELSSLGVDVNNDNLNYQGNGDNKGNEDNKFVADDSKELVSRFFWFKNIGLLISAYLQGYLVEILSFTNIFMLTAIIPLMYTLIGILIIEQDNNKQNLSAEAKNSKVNSNQANDNKKIESDFSTTNNDDLTTNLLPTNSPNIPSNIPNDAASKIKEYLYIIKSKHLLIPILFSMILNCGPTYGDPFFYYMTNFLNIPPTKIATLTVISTIGILIGIQIYKKYLRKFEFKTITIVTTLVFTFFSIMVYLLILRLNIYIGISDVSFLGFGFLFASVAGEISVMPILSIACVLCPPNYEASVYSTFMSAINLGSMLGTLLSSVLSYNLGITSDNFSMLPMLILISNLYYIIPIGILLIMDRKYFNPKVDEDGVLLD